MKTYKIVHTETLVGWYYVDAETPEEAIEEFNREAEEGCFDFSDMEMVDSDNRAEEIEERDDRL